MMKIKSAQKPYKKYVLVGIIIILALVVSTSLYVYVFNGNILGWTKQKNDSSINLDKPTDEQKQAGDNVKKDTVENNTSNSKPTNQGSEQSASPTPQPDGKSTVELNITAANQNGATLQVRSLIFSLVSSGTCTLTLTKDNTVVTKTAKVQAQASSSTCLGFDIPTAELSAGTWQAKLVFENETVTGNAQKTVIIE